MPRKLTIECTCDRCRRIWYEPYIEGEDPPAAASLALMYAEPGAVPEEVRFNELCAGCSKAVGNLVEKLKKLAKPSPRRSGAKKGAAQQAAPPEEEVAQPVKRRGARPSPAS